MNEEIICAFSGLQPKDDDLVDATDELGDMPVDWSKITIQTRKENPEWNMLQAVKLAMAQQLEGQIAENVTKEERDIATVSIRLQVEAQFASLEDRIPQYLIDERIAYISNPKENSEISELYDKLLENLDLKEE